MSESETIDDGGSAFPAMLPGGNYCTPGMSLLDWFAGQALAGIISSDSVPDGRSFQKFTEDVAEMAYRFATAMLNERERINAVKS